MKSVIEQKNQAQVRFLRLPEVLARTGLSRSTVYVRLEQGRFPGRSRWALVPLVGSSLRWTSGCVSELQRAAVTASEAVAALTIS